MGEIFCLCVCRCGRSPWLRAGGKLQYGIHGDGWGVSFPSSLPLLGTQLTQPTGGLRRCGTLQALPNARGTTTCWHSGLLVCLRGSQETAGSWQDQSAGESYLQVMMNTKIVVLLGSGPVHQLLFGTEHSACETSPCCGTVKKVTLTVPWGQFDRIVKNVTTLIRLFQEFHDCHHLAPLPNLVHLHLFHCRNLTLHWTRGCFQPSSNYFSIVLMFTIDVT